MNGTLPGRVLMTADAVGGVWTCALELADGLSAHGVETVLAVLGPSPDDGQRATAWRIPGLLLVETGLDLEWRDRRGPCPVAARTLTALAKRTRADIVHVNGFREAASGFDVPVVLAAHSCVRSWWRACRGGEPPAEWNAYLSGLRAGLDAASVLVAPTGAFLDELRRLHAPLPPALAIHNGRRPIATAGTRRSPFILAAGRLWDEAKNARLLAEASPRLPWPVRIAGPGGSDETAVNLVRIGPVPPERLRRLMAEAEIFCAPALYEPFGLAVLEAAQGGAALLLSDLPSFRELWDGAACFVPANDTERLVEAANEMAADAALRTELRTAARRRAARFTRERMTTAFLDLYARLLAAPRPAERAA